MTEKAVKAPWWKRVWAAVGAILLGALGALALLKGKSYLAGRQMASAQKKDNADLKADLKEVKATRSAKLEIVSLQEALDQQKLRAEHEERVREIDQQTEEKRQDLANRPDAVPDALLRSLEGAERKLKR